MPESIDSATDSSLFNRRCCAPLRARIPARSRQHRLEMVGQAEAQRDKRQSGVRRPRGRVHRGPGDVQIAQPVHAAVGVNDTLLGIRVHTRRPHVMPPAAQERRPGAVVAQQPIANLHATHFAPPYLLTQQLVERADGALVQFREQQAPR